MKSFVSTLYRDFTCAVAAAVITVVIGLSFVQSTSVAPGQAAAHTAQRA